ncbi:MAG: O-antigen ligase family protein, partial [Acidobacteriaceae bacterium]|nr:O-antigen ligase family protein [Acidobacteriaceae bacterium]
ALAVLVSLLVADWFLQYRQPGAGSALVYELAPIGFYVGARALPPRHIPTVALIVVIAGALGGLTVIYEFLRGHVVFHNPTAYDWNSTNNSIFRPGGVFGSPPAASSVMCCVVLFGIACMATSRGKKKLLVGLCTVVATAALVLTFTRAAMIAAGLGIILLLWLIRSPLLRPLRVAWFVAVVAAVYFVMVPSLQGNRTFQQGIERGGTLAAREGYWGVALPVATSSAHDFILGAGTGSLEALRTAPNAIVASRIATSPTLTGNSLHSQYMTTLFEQGAIGLAVLVVVLLAGIIPSARIARSTRDPIVAATAAIIVAFAVIMSVDTVSLVPPAFAMLMLALGFAGALREEDRIQLGQTA